jgi:hypothetical protein
MFIYCLIRFWQIQTSPIVIKKRKTAIRINIKSLMKGIVTPKGSRRCQENKPTHQEIIKKSGVNGEVKK